MKNSSDTIGNRSRDLPIYSAVPQPLRHRVPPLGLCKIIFETAQMTFFQHINKCVISFDRKHKIGDQNIPLQLHCECKNLDKGHVPLHR
jgi:hypothetical protein